MALTEKTTVYLGIQDNGVIELRRTRQISDGIELIGEQHKRIVYTPDMALNTVPAGKIRQIATVVWTPQVVADYIASLPQSPIP